MHAFDKPQLDSLREAVLDEKCGRALERLSNKLTESGYVLGGRDRKTVPRGFDREHPRAHWLLHNGLDLSYQGKGSPRRRAVKRSSNGAPHMQGRCGH